MAKISKATFKAIMEYDADDIHEACETLGHSTGWEYFDKELATYSEEDGQRLLAELRDQFLTEDEQREYFKLEEQYG